MCNPVGWHDVMIKSIDVRGNVLTHVTRTIAEGVVETKAFKSSFGQTQLSACAKGQTKHDLAIDLIAIYNRQRSRSIIDESGNWTFWKRKDLGNNSRINKMKRF